MLVSLTMGQQWQCNFLAFRTHRTRTSQCVILSLGLGKRKIPIMSGGRLCIRCLFYAVQSFQSSARFDFTLVAHDQAMSAADWEDSQDVDRFLQQEETDKEHDEMLQWGEDEGLEEERPINAAGDGFEDWQALLEGEGEDAAWPQEEEAAGCLAENDRWPQDFEEKAEPLETWPDEDWDEPAEKGWERDSDLNEEQ